MNDWRVRTAFEDARIAVLVVESSQLAPTTSPSACHLVATLAPEAVIVAQGEGFAAFDVEGRAIDATSLEERFSAVAAAIQELRR